MPEDFSHLNDEERLKAENEFLKMKLMLENGASFGKMDTEKNLSPKIENEFLNYIAEFEKQSQNPTYTTVFDKIERPRHFRPVADIPEKDIERAWNELSGYLYKYGISLDVCSPNISATELYRFTTEELFQHKISDMNIPGMMNGFIYDEFHPDLVYDNSRQVEQNLLRDIFSKSDLFFEIDYPRTGFIFNDIVYTERQPYIGMINRFKSLFDEIELTACEIAGCSITGNDCVVSGNYSALAKSGNTETVYKGNFRVELAENDMDYWNFTKIQIDGFRPQ